MDLKRFQLVMVREEMDRIPIIMCPLCGKKHPGDFCLRKNQYVPENVIIFEFGFDEKDDDFAYGEDE